MPKVDPDSGEMMTDDPELDLQSGGGGKKIGDLPKGANPTGSEAVTQKGRSVDSDPTPTTGD